MKKGQGISVNMIIILVMALIVLIIAVLLLMNNSKNGNKALGTCESLGGYCNNNNPCPDGTTQNVLATSCGSTTSSLPCCAGTKPT